MNLFKCDGSGTMEVCSTTFPHKHCVCGLAMKLTAEYCDLCLRERLIPSRAESEAEWDGRTYPSLRLCRTRSPNPESYIWLAEAMRGEHRTFYSAVQSWRHAESA